MEKKKMKNTVLLLMIIGLIVMGILNGFMYKFKISDTAIVVIDITYAIILGLSLRGLNRKLS